MTAHTRLFPRLLPALALVAAAMALPTPASAADTRPVVRFQDYPGHGNLLIRVARSKGWCEAAGITCELKPIPQAPLGVQALIGGSIDVAQTPIEVLASAVQRGAKLRAVVGSAVTNIFQVDVATGVKLPHEAEGYPAMMQDFKGKKIGVVARGSASESFFTYLMQQAGHAESDVTYVAVGAPNTAFAALRQGQVDAISSFEPAGGMCEISKACRIVYRGATAEKPALLRSMYGAGIALVMRTDQIATQPKVVQAVVKISQQAAEFVNNPDNEAEVLKISAQYFPYDMPQGNTIAKYALGQGVDSNTYKTMVRRSAVQSTLTYLQQTKQLPSMPKVEDIVWDGAPQE